MSKLIINQKEDYNPNDATPATLTPQLSTEISDIYYNCTECASLIEIIIRLKEINFLSIDSSYEKNHLNYIYDIALNYDINKIKIFNRLKKDTEYFNSRNSLYKRNIFDEFRSENTDGFQNNLFSREIRKNNIICPI